MTSTSYTRREILRHAAAGGVVLTTGAQLGERLMADEASPTPADHCIDAHVHVWTPDTEKYPLAPGRGRDEMQPPSFTPGQLLEQARPCGVDRVVLVQMSFYGFDNSYMLDTIRTYPGVFSGIAVIDDQGPDPAAEMRRLKPLGVRGFRIYPRGKKAEPWLDSPGMMTMWKYGAEERMAMCCLTNPADLPAIAQQCAKYPDTPVVIDHFGRVGVDGTIRPAELDHLCHLARHKNTYVKVSAFYALGKKAAPYTDLGPMIRRLMEAYGRERLMWATDCPYQVQSPHTYRDSIELVRSRLDFLTAEDRLWLLRKTAERVFFD